MLLLVSRNNICIKGQLEGLYDICVCNRCIFNTGSSYK